MTQGTIFDRKALLKRIGGNEALCDELISIFIERVPAQIERLKEFLDRQDADRVKIEAHSLKGMAVNLSAVRFSGIAAEIEKTAGKGHLSGVPDLVRKLESAFHKFKVYV
ncbi:MAG: Hpt domain-containing protein [Thermodesulfobacteriota bacterium]